MDTTGKLTGASRTLNGQGIILTFEVDASAAGQVENMRSDDLLRIRAVKYKQKRSLDANAYAWVLMTKIANHPDISSSKEDVYEQMLQKYGTLYEDEDGYITITVKKSVDMSKVDGHWKFIKDNGKFASYLMIKGSSEYDTAEMSHFIDRIVEEAKELGIETATPDELERMKQEWGT
nr:MAG TPA: NinB protein [Caudoviricetes sp.]